MLFPRKSQISEISISYQWEHVVSLKITDFRNIKILNAVSPTRSDFRINEHQQYPDPVGISEEFRGLFIEMSSIIMPFCRWTEHGEVFYLCLVGGIEYTILFRFKLVVFHKVK